LKKIKLSNGEFTLVDDKDFNYLNQFRWYLNGTSKYAIRYGKIDNKPRVIFMHKEVMSISKGTEVDHINRRTLDNQKNNLRLCTRLQNQGNSEKYRTNKSGYKGVSWHKKSGKWQAYIGDERKYLGIYKIKEEAALAYNNAARERYGEFAYLNHLTAEPNC